MAMRRVLGLFDTTCVVVGAIVGVGIFFTPKDVAALAGSEGRAMFVWALGGLAALLGALTFAELGRLYPRAGGQYDVLRDAWGSPAAFLYAFCSLTAIETGSVAIIAVICADNAARAATGATPAAATILGLALALIVGLSGTNAIGVRWGASIQNGTVVLKVATLAAVFGLAAWVGEGPPEEAPAPSEEGTAALFAALVPALFSYGGWQQALWIGGEVKDGERTLPRAIVGGVVLVIAVYLAAAWAFFRLLGFPGVVGSDALAADAVARVLPGTAERAVAAAVAVSAFGVLNAQFLTAPRLTWAMANDGRFFRAFASVHPRRQTPVAAIVLLGILSVLLLIGAGADGVGPLTAWVVVIDALFFALTALALLRLRPATPYWIAVAGAFAALELAAVLGAVAQPDVRGAALVGCAWVAGAAIFYAAFFRRGVEP